MQFEITSHHIEVTSELNTYIQEKFDRICRHFDSVLNIQMVTLREENLFDHWVIFFKKTKTLLIISFKSLLQNIILIQILRSFFRRKKTSRVFAYSAKFYSTPKPYEKKSKIAFMQIRLIEEKGNV